MKNRIMFIVIAIILTCYSHAQSGVNAEDATWEVYTNRSDARCLALSDDGSTLWVGTWAGLEERNLQTGKCNRLYTRLDGLPENSISSLATDGNEGLWIGTDGGGVAHLNGGTWQIFNSSNSELPFNNISSLLIDGSGGVWIGTEGFGLAHLRSDNRWEFFDKSTSGVPDNYISSLLDDGNGGIWVGTEGGLTHRNRNGEWKIYDKRDSGGNGSRLPDNYVISLLNDNSGGLWIGTQFGGFAHLKSDNTWEIFDQGDSGKLGSKLPDNQVTALSGDGNGGLWIGTWEHGLVHWKADGTWTVYDQSSSMFPDNNVRCLSVDAQKGTWVGTYGGGLAYLKAGSNVWEVFDNTGLPGNEVASLMSDGKKGIWAGTDRGLGHLEADGTWRVFNTEISALPETVTSVADDGNNGVWVGTRTGRGRSGGLFRIKQDGSMHSFHKENSSLPDNEISALLNDGSSGVWIGTANGGLAHRNRDGEWEIYDRKDSGMNGSKLPSDSVVTLENDGSGGIWIGTEGFGLVHLGSDKRWELFDKSGSGVPDNNISSLLNDGSGGVWIGTANGGLSHRSRNGEWKTYDKRDSGMNGSKLPSDSVAALADDGSGGIWIGTWEGGLAHLESDQTWEIFDTGNSGLPDNRVKSLTADQGYGLWVGTYDGLAHLTFGKKSDIVENIEDEETIKEITDGKRAALIIAAGSTSLKENRFWYSTEYLTSQFIYSAFYNRGYDHSDIYYLSPKSWANFNSDGRNDFIVDAPVTSKENGKGVRERSLNSDDVLKAFEWAKSRGKLTQPFYIYFVDHGEPGQLMLTRFEALRGETLSNMIADYQEATGNTVVVIIEACYSGSMIPYLSGTNRVIITSSRADQESYYDQNGDISFTAAFLMNIDGTNLKDALSYAKETMKNEFSIPAATPLLDDDGDGEANDDFDGTLASRFGINGTWGRQSANIAIDAVGEARTVTTGEAIVFEAKVHATGAIKKVWGVVRSPYPQVVYDDFGTPMLQNPDFILTLTSSDPKGYDIYTGSFNGFSCSGDYSVTFFAKDHENRLDVSSSLKITATGGNICVPPDETKAVTRVFSSNTVYYQDDTVKVQVQNRGDGQYDQYTAMFWPDGQYRFLTSQNNFSDRFFPAWETSTVMNNLPVTVLDMPVAELPVLSGVTSGIYQIYNLLVPSGSDPIEVLDRSAPEQWVLWGTAFEVVLP
ncbi:MAG: hypothetical protein HQK62_13095 [Desulfamplus sp.]|nr:hypothetical protein [Desulfamplus sp.]